MKRSITSRVVLTFLISLCGFTAWADDIVITSANFADYFEYDSDFELQIATGNTVTSDVGGFFLKDAVTAGSNLDFKGDFIPPTDGKNTRVFISKRVNITSSDKSAVFKSGDTGLYWCFGVSEGGDQTEIKNLQFDNCWVFNHGASYVTFDSISMNVHDATIGTSFGAMSIATVKDGGHTSDHSTIKNSTFCFANNGKTPCVVVGKGGQYATVDNNIIEGNSNVANVLYASFTGYGNNPEYVTFTNNVITREGSATSTSYGIAICGNGNLVENNTVTYAGYGITTTFNSSASSELAKNIYRNNTIIGGGSMTAFAYSIVENNHVSGTLTINQGDSVIYNTASQLTISNRDAIIQNNTSFGNVRFNTNASNTTFIGNAVNGIIQYSGSASNNTITGNAIVSTESYAITHSKASTGNTIEGNMLISSGNQGNDAVNPVLGANNTIQNNTGGTIITNETETMVAGNDGGTFYYVPASTTVTIPGNVSVTGSAGQRLNIILYGGASLTINGQFTASDKTIGIYALTNDATTGKMILNAIDYGELMISSGIVVVDNDTIDTGYYKKQPVTDYELTFNSEYKSVPSIYAGSANYFKLEIENTSSADGSNVNTSIYADDLLVWEKDTVIISASEKVVWLANDPTIRPVTENTIYKNNNDTVFYKIVIKEDDVVKKQQEFPFVIVYNGNLGKDYAYPSYNQKLRKYSFTGDVTILVGDEYISNAGTSKQESFNVDLNGGSFHKALLYVSYNWDKVNDGDFKNWETTFNGKVITPLASYRDHGNLGPYGRYGYGLIVYDVTKCVVNGDNTFALQKPNGNVAVYPSSLIVMVANPYAEPKSVYILEEADLLSKTYNQNVDAVYTTSFEGATGQEASLYVFAAGAQSGEGDLIINGNLNSNVWSGTSNSLEVYETGVTPGNITVQFKSTGSTILALHQMVVVKQQKKVGDGLSKNPNKFLGNITTRNQVDAGGGVPAYYTLWNQITPENESKWGSVEGNRGSYNWGSDTPFNYAKNHGFTYKFHALVWGAQYPDWFTSSLPVQERYNAIVKWFDEVKKHYPDLPMIDVVNEAVTSANGRPHQPGNPLMKESLGGGGKTGYDWLIKAFELAHERWPNAILIYNDYNTFKDDTDAYIELVRTLRDAGAPIDAYGCQSHDVNTISKSDLQNAMAKIQNAVKMPMYITELDVDVENDNQQKTQYQNIFPVMWEADYCAGVTVWGYVYGATWVDHSGLYKNGVERPAMTWLKTYMASDNAKNAKSPFPGGKKPISLYIKPASITAEKGIPLPITVRAQLLDTVIVHSPDDKDTIRIDSVKLFVKGVLDTIMTKAPYIAQYIPTTTGKHALKAVVYASNGKTYEREGGFTAGNPRSTFGATPISLPGTIQAENFDKGGDGITYHDSKSGPDGNEVVNYRSDNNDVDIVDGNGGKAVGYTSDDEWLEYSVDITKTGYYYYHAVASSGTTNSGFKLSLNTEDGLVDITPNISVPQTASNNWDTYKTIDGKTLIELEQGKHIIRLTITGSSCNIDKISFDHIQIDETLNLKITSTPAPTATNHMTTLHFNTIDPEREDAISSVRVYINNTLSATLKSKPFDFNYKPNKQGTIKISAVAIDTLKHESNLCSYSLQVLPGRTIYSSVTLPGTVEAENFDKCLEGITYHDSDSIDEGEAKYRTDNQGVDIIRIEGGYAIGYTAEDEWLEYTLNFKYDGYYFIRPRVCFETESASFRIGLMKDGQETPLANVSFPEDCALNTYEILPPIYFTENINKGQNTIRITITSPGCNIDNFQIRFDKPTDVKYITNDDNYANGTRYNLGGQRVNEYNNKGITIINGKKVIIIE